MNRRNRHRIFDLGILNETKSTASEQELDATAFEYHPDSSELWVQGESYKINQIDVRSEVFDVARTMNANKRRTYMSFDKVVRIDIGEDGDAVVREK